MPGKPAGRNDEHAEEQRARHLPNRIGDDGGPRCHPLSPAAGNHRQKQHHEHEANLAEQRLALVGAPSHEQQKRQDHQRERGVQKRVRKPPEQVVVGDENGQPPAAQGNAEEKERGRVHGERLRLAARLGRAILTRKGRDHVGPPDPFCIVHAPPAPP